MKSNNSSITLIIGPKLSGKTNELFDKIRYDKVKDITGILIAPNLESYDPFETNEHDHTELVSNYDQSQKLQGYKCDPSDLLNLIPVINENEEHIDIIYIDDGHVFKDLIKFVDSIMEKRIETSLIITMLSGDFSQKPILALSNLIPRAYSIIHKIALCYKCKEDASFSTWNEDYGCEKEERFKPICRKCLYPLEFLMNQN